MAIDTQVDTPSIYVESHRGDGTTIVIDPIDNVRYEIRTLLWAPLTRLPKDMQRKWLRALGVPC